MLQNPLVPPALSTRSRRSVVRGAAGAVGLLLLGNWRLASGAGEAATEANLPQVAPVPGGIVRVSLGPSQERPRAWAGEVPLLVLGDPIEWSALVGIPLSATPGEARIVVQGEAREPRELAYTVTPKRYAEQRLKVAPKTVDLSPEDLARFERERALAPQATLRFRLLPRSPKVDMRGITLNGVVLLGTTLNARVGQPGAEGPEMAQALALPRIGGQLVLRMRHRGGGRMQRDAAAVAGINTTNQ